MATITQEKRNVWCVLLFGLGVAAACLTTKPAGGYLILAACFSHLAVVATIIEGRYAKECQRTKHMVTDGFAALAALFAVLSLATPLVREFAIVGVSLVFIVLFGTLSEDCEERSDGVYPYLP